MTAETGRGATTRTWPIFAFLAGFLWAARYWLSRGFGLYEDDCFRVIDGWDLPAGALAAQVGDLFANFASYGGRPLHDAPIWIFSFAGFQLGGLQGAYLAGFALLYCNVLLVYVFAYQLSRDRLTGFLAAAGFAVFPADTTQAFLTHTFGLQPSLTLVLGALLLYFHGRRFWAYCLACLAAFGYETVFPVFVAAPLLSADSGRRLWLGLARHTVVCGGILAGAAILRAAAGEARVANMAFGDTVMHALRNTAAGPVISMKQSIVRPASELLQQTREHAVLLGIILAVLCALVWLLTEDERPRLNAASGPAGDGLPLSRLALSAAVMLFLAYPMTLTVPATVVHGRGSRVHFAAALGAALLLSCLHTLILRSARRKTVRSVAVFLICAALTGGVAAGLAVQHDYADSWSYQRSFWTDVMELCPDAGEDTIIVADPAHLRDTREAMVLGWNTVIFPKYLFEFPETWSRWPAVTTLKRNWRELSEAGEPVREWIDWKGTRLWIGNAYLRPDYIFLQVSNGRLHRRTDPLKTKAGTVFLKEHGRNTLGGLPKRPLYGALILGPGEARAAYAAAVRKN